MSRIGAPTKRMSARVRIGRVNDDIDYTPHIFQQEGLIQRVASPGEQKRGIIGYTARGTVTLDSLKRETARKYDSKIKQLEQKKKDVSLVVAQIYSEGQQELKKLQQKTKVAQKLKDVIPFERARSVVGEFVNLKVDVVRGYETQIQRVQNEIKRSQDYQRELNDRRRGATGERKIDYLYDRRDERAYENALRKELEILNDFKNRNLRELKFGEEVGYYPPEMVSKYAEDVRRVEYGNASARIYNRRQRAIASYKQEEATKQTVKQLTRDYPHLTKETAKAITEKAVKEGRKTIPIPQIDPRKDPVGWGQQVVRDKVRRWW